MIILRDIINVLQNVICSIQLVEVVDLDVSFLESKEDVDGVMELLVVQTIYLQEPIKVPEKYN